MLRRCGEPQSLTTSQRSSPHVSTNEKQAIHSTGLASRFHTIQWKNLRNFLANLIPNAKEHTATREKKKERKKTELNCNCPLLLNK